MTGAVASATLASTPVQAFEKHEHVFWDIGKNYSQNDGDKKCKDIHWSKAFSLRPVAVRGIYTAYPAPTRAQAWDGTILATSVHNWYHKQQGLCLMNTPRTPGS